MINFGDRPKNPSFAISKSVSIISTASASACECLPFSWIQILNIFQMHYPERLAESLIINVPFLIHAFFRMIGPFIDPVTRNKIKFNPKPVEEGMFTADELFKEGGWGGSRDFVWDHEKYWPAFVQMCDEIVKEQMARWRRLGAQVGCDEKAYKSEDDVVDEGAVSQAHCQTKDETSAAESAI